VYDQILTLISMFELHLDSERLGLLKGYGQILTLISMFELHLDSERLGLLMCMTRFCL
jgi:hypothetical protein